MAGIYYAAQQVASLPQKLKTSFEPILAPVITRNVAAGNLNAIARQVTQVGFWIVAAQLVSRWRSAYRAKRSWACSDRISWAATGALGALLAAEVLAAPAVVSEAALVYLARYRNMLISLVTIGVQGVLTGRALMQTGKGWDLPPLYIAALPAIALACALALGAGAKSLLLGHLCGEHIGIWRQPRPCRAHRRGRRHRLHLAAAQPRMGRAAVRHSGDPGAFCAVIWTVGFRPGGPGAVPQAGSWGTLEIDPSPGAGRGDGFNIAGS